MPRIVRIKKQGSLISCPKCMNNEVFKAFSEQVGEDVCEVWVECGNCGFDPTKDNTNYRLEDVFGGTCDSNVMAALQCWTEAILELHPKDETTKVTCTNLTRYAARLSKNTLLKQGA